MSDEPPKRKKKWKELSPKEAWEAMKRGEGPTWEDELEESNEKLRERIMKGDFFTREELDAMERDWDNFKPLALVIYGLNAVLRISTVLRARDNREPVPIGTAVAALIPLYALSAGIAVFVATGDLNIAISVLALWLFLAFILGELLNMTGMEIHWSSDGSPILVKAPPAPAPEQPGESGVIMGPPISKVGSASAMVIGATDAAAAAVAAAAAKRSAPPAVATPSAPTRPPTVAEFKVSFPAEAVAAASVALFRAPPPGSSAFTTAEASKQWEEVRRVMREILFSGRRSRRSVVGAFRSVRLAGGARALRAGGHVLNPGTLVPIDDRSALGRGRSGYPSQRWRRAFGQGRGL